MIAVYASGALGSFLATFEILLIPEIIEQLVYSHAALSRVVLYELQVRQKFQNDLLPKQSAYFTMKLSEEVGSLDARFLSAQHIVIHAGSAQIRLHHHFAYGDHNGLVLEARVQDGTDLALDQLVDSNNALSHGN